jgi:hypothetical protein
MPARYVWLGGYAERSIRFRIKADLSDNALVRLGPSA